VIFFKNRGCQLSCYWNLCGEWRLAHTTNKAAEPPRTVTTKGSPADSAFKGGCEPRGLCPVKAIHESDLLVFNFFKEINTPNHCPACL